MMARAYFVVEDMVSGKKCKHKHVALITTFGCAMKAHDRGGKKARILIRMLVGDRTYPLPEVDKQRLKRLAKAYGRGNRNWGW